MKLDPALLNIAGGLLLLYTVLLIVFILIGRR